MRPRPLPPVVLILILAGCGLGTLDHWSPDTSLPPGAAFLTPAEHDRVMEGRDWPYIAHIVTAGGGQVLYYGSRHTGDPHDAQIGEIARLFGGLSPTVAVTENAGGFYLGGRDRAVRALGEFGAVIELGDSAGIPVWTLEPSWEDEVRYVTEVFSAAEATMFYTLRVFLSERGDNLDRDEVNKLARHLLRKRGSRPGLEGSLLTLADMDVLWAESFGEERDWRDLPEDAVHPGLEDTRLQSIARRVNMVRDIHAARVILDLVRDGHRVFAIAGGSHVVKQVPVILAGLEGLQPELTISPPSDAP